jgi:predicted AAA+ superfamily ATPase
MDGHGIPQGGGYVPRVVDAELDALFGELPAVLLDGAKGVGKTSTAHRRCRTVRRLDVPAERAIVEADPAVVRGDQAPVLIDEWQRVPSVFDAVRRLVDDEPSRGGRFMLTGSASPGQTHSGAGRITTMRMRPLTLFERHADLATVSFGELLTGRAPAVAGRSPFTLADYTAEIAASGFPGLRHLTARARELQLDSYIDRIVDQDMPEAGFTVRRPATVLACLRAYAASISTTTSWDKIRNAATSGIDDKPARSTTVPYTELLTRLRILDPLDAWVPTRNHLAALTVAPKHHLADPALAVRLVRLSAARLLHGDGPSRPTPRDGTYLGGLFESLAALSIRTFAQRHNARAYHLRTRGGRHEVDFVVEGEHGIVGFEAKLASAVTDADVSHLRWLREQLGDGCVEVVVLSTGPEAYRRSDGVAVVPLALLGP